MLLMIVLLAVCCGEDDGYAADPALIAGNVLLVDAVYGMMLAGCGDKRNMNGRSAI